MVLKDKSRLGSKVRGERVERKADSVFFDTNSYIYGFCNGIQIQIYKETTRGPLA